MNKYKHKIPKDDLKRFAKDVAKKLVASDYKAGRVENPTKISEKQQKKVKAYCKDYFEKAAQKHKKIEEEKTARKDKLGASSPKPSSLQPTPLNSPPATGHSQLETPKKEEDDEDIKMSDIEDHDTMPQSPSESTKYDSLKRKRSADLDALVKEEDDDLTKSPAKKLNLDINAILAPPPPPPPAPPAGTPSDHNSPADLAEHEHIGETEPDIHADTNFKGKSMADVLAQAQQEDEVDWGMEGEET